MKIELITEEKAKKYRKEIAQFYFENVQACSFFENYTYDEAFEKVGDFIDHLENGTAMNSMVMCGLILIAFEKKTDCM